METFTTAKILEFVVGAVITMGVENLPTATKKLYQTIRNRLQNKPVASTAISEIEENNSTDQIPNLAPFLDVEMLSDETFKQEVQQLAKEAMNQDKETINIHVAKAEKSTVVGKQKSDNLNNYNAEEINNIGTQNVINVKKD
ncbi:hypothetical protein [Crocosphaera sp.]|uniref:hypothetical protein n=1 Tax=Crocosphaera sp. TaxID=2729996 RepID=UPI003F27B044|nr:hypothetical protein [Crocosphaera sp.]